MTNGSSENAWYQPSMAARTAKVVLPVLGRVMPGILYRRTYDLLYSSYKLVIRGTYYCRTMIGRSYMDPYERRKRELTSRLLPFTMGGPKALESTYELTLKAQLEEVPGELIECGVAEGGTAAMMALVDQEFGNGKRTKRFFDSYEGLPEPTIEDYTNGKTGDFVRPLPKGSCLGTLDQVSELLFEELNLPRESIHLVQGWFQDTVPVEKDNVAAIAVLRLDGDWYESTKIPLEAFFDKVSHGGYVIIDDYGTCFGSRKATDEFLKSRKCNIELHPDGRGGAWFKVQ